MLACALISVHTARAGDALAYVSLAHMHNHGKGVPVNHAQAFEYEMKAADAGAEIKTPHPPYACQASPLHSTTSPRTTSSAKSPFAGTMLVSMRQGTAQDYTKAREYFIKAADQGFTFAQARLYATWRR